MNKAQNPVSNPINVTVDPLTARRFVEKRGRLLSHVLLDNIAVNLWPIFSEPDRRVFSECYPACAKEVLIYPEIRGQFKKGKDVIDQDRDNSGRQWVFPGSHIPADAIGRSKVGLFVNPKDILVEKYTKGKNAVIIHPKSIIVVENLVEDSGKGGMMHEETRLPIDVSPEVLETLPEGQKRWLYRVKGPGVRYLVRHIYDSPVRHSIFAAEEHDAAFRIVVDDLKEIAASVVEVSKTLLEIAKQLERLPTDFIETFSGRLTDDIHQKLIITPAKLAKTLREFADRLNKELAQS